MILSQNIIEEYCYIKVKECWLSTENSFPDFLKSIPDDMKAQNEEAIKGISNEISSQFRDFPRLPFKRNKWKMRLLSTINDFLCKESLINLHTVTNEETVQSFQDELKDLLRHIREFSPELTFEDMGQAVRNYMVYIMFKELNNVTMDFNKAAFGYSMLYPFTDNYIDSTENTPATKKEYNEMIKDKIEGNPVNPKTKHQRKTCDLLQAIASHYPREQDSSIYTLLLMMLEAQDDSLQQQNNAISLTFDERLNISLYKGGVSVLIDRYLIDKAITEDDLFFYLAFGYFLQLADDLQDIGTDSIQGNKTIFTVDLSPEHEEKIVNQMLHFVYSIIDSYPSENEDFKDFILRNCYYLVYSSAIGSKEFFTDQYIDKLGNLLPVTTEFLEHIKHNNIETLDLEDQGKYKKILDNLTR